MSNKRINNIITYYIRLCLDRKVEHTSFQPDLFRGNRVRDAFCWFFLVTSKFKINRRNNNDKYTLLYMCVCVYVTGLLYGRLKCVPRQMAEYVICIFCTGCSTNPIKHPIYPDPIKLHSEINISHDIIFHSNKNNIYPRWLHISALPISSMNKN